jgi:hypothetical protein
VREGDAIHGARREVVCADPERQFRVEGVFELPLNEGDSRPWSASRVSHPW